MQSFPATYAFLQLSDKNIICDSHTDCIFDMSGSLIAVFWIAQAT